MTASEFAFMALGLVVGLSSGAALLYVIRARPPAPPEIRLTVASDAVPRRIPATLSTDAFASPAEPARGGPADRRSVDRPIDALAERPPKIAGGRPIEPAQDRPADIPVAAPPTTLVVASAGDPAGAPHGERSAIPVHFEPDPAMEALRSVAPEAALVGAAPQAVLEDVRSSGGRDQARGGPSGGDPGAPRDAAYDAAYEAGQQVVLGAKSDAGPTTREARLVPTIEARGSTGSGPAEQPADPSGPCGDLAAQVDHRCREAEVARLRSDTAARAVAAVRKDQARERQRADRARETADPVRLHEQKEAARATFRAARHVATDRQGMDEAARVWLASINRLNAATRKANQARDRADAAAAAFMPSLERLSAEADAARVTAESAVQGCIDAQAALAACLEPVVARPTADDVAAIAAVPSDAPAPAARSGTPPAADPLPADPETAAPWSETPGLGVPRRAGRLSMAGGTPVVVRIVRGDREARTLVAAALDRALPDADVPWADRLAEFADAIRVRAVEESMIDVAPADPFWASFTQPESREIVRALAALGYRYDGDDGWSDDHVPIQRDLSMAVGYAGHDPMRIRHWPTEAALAELFRDAHVGADEYLESTGGELSLGEVIEMLGPHADPLTSLWDAWDLVRPLLLAEDDLPT